MWMLMKYEYKKLFQSRLLRILLLLAFILPCFYAFYLASHSNIYASLNSKVYYEWFEKLYHMLNAFGVIFAILIVLLVTPIFVQEKDFQMDDVIKVTEIGKRKLGKAKLLSCLIMTIVIPLIAFTLFIVFVYFSCDYTSENAQLCIYNQLLPYTFIDVIMYGMLVILLGGVALCSLSLFISAILNKVYIAISVSLALLLIPIVISINVKGFLISVLFPLFFMTISNVFVYCPLISIGNTVMYYKDFIFLEWIPISIALLLLSLYKYQRR